MCKLCDYGCGNEGKYLLKNGKYCCSITPNKCEFVRKKNQNAHLNHKYKECPFCHKKITINIGGQYTQHIRYCSSIYDKKIILKSKNSQKYLNWYNNIIQYRQNNPLIEGYREEHHIIPKSLGGSNMKNNLIYLTAREHYICHMLLVEIYRNDQQSYLKMLAAFMMMKSRGINSKIYEKYRLEYSISKKGTGKGELNNNYGNKWVTNPITKEHKLIDANLLDEYLSNGWIKGRIKNWDKFYAKQKGISSKIYYCNKKKGLSIKKIIQEYDKKENKKKIYKNEMVKLYSKYYKEYKKNGYKGVVKKFGYNKSKSNLVQQFHRYVIEYNSKN